MSAPAPAPAQAEQQDATEQPQSQPAATTTQPEAANTDTEQVQKKTRKKVAKVLKASHKKAANTDKELTPKQPQQTPGHESKKEVTDNSPPHGDGKKEGGHPDKKDDDKEKHDEERGHAHHTKKFAPIPSLTTGAIGKYYEKRKKKTWEIFGSIGNALLVPFAPLRYLNSFIPWKGMKNGVVNTAKATKNGIKKTVKTAVLALWYLAQAGLEKLTSGGKKIGKLSKKEKGDDLKLEPLTPPIAATHDTPATAAHH